MSLYVLLNLLVQGTGPGASPCPPTPDPECTCLAPAASETPQCAQSFEASTLHASEASLAAQLPQSVHAPGSAAERGKCHCPDESTGLFEARLRHEVVSSAKIAPWAPLLPTPPPGNLQRPRLEELTRSAFTTS